MKTDEINKTIIENITKTSIALSDKDKTYIDVSKYAEAHIREKSTKQTMATTLKRVHIAISNAKINF